MKTIRDGAKAFLLSFVLVLIPYISQAEIKTYTHTVKQSFGGSQSPDDARVAAIHKAKREALEKAGTYLESLTIVKNSMVEKDEILALAAGVLKAEIVSQENFHTKDAFGIIVVAKVDVDTSVLEKRIKKLLNDRELLKKYQESQKQIKELLAKNVLLEIENRKLSTSPASADTQKKEELKKQFRENTQGLTAVELYIKAGALLVDGKHTNPSQSLDYLNKAIRLDAKYAGAYVSRGQVYVTLGQYQRAVEDYTQAIRLDPKDSLPFLPRKERDFFAYAARGAFYEKMGQYQRAIEDYTQTIRLAPKDADASEEYNSRGRVYEKLEQYQLAIEDYTQAIHLGPKNVATNYKNLGFAYYYKGDYDRVIDYIKKALEIDLKKLGPEHQDVAPYYNNLGKAYDNKGDYDRAIDYYQKALKINLKRLGKNHPSTKIIQKNIDSVKKIVLHRNLL